MKREIGEGALERLKDTAILVLAVKRKDGYVLKSPADECIVNAIDSLLYVSRLSR
jgi:hypothetical protein